MLAKDNMPFRTVEKVGFQGFMKTVAPLYKVPSRKVITQCMKGKYDLLSGIIKTKLEAVVHLSLTTDVWTDTLNTKSYLGVTAHFISGQKQKSVTIGVTELDDKHTSANLERWLLEIVEEWKIKQENITVVVSDNAANIKKAIVDAFGADKHLPCFAHTLNLVPSKIIDKDVTISSLCAKIKKNRDLL